jgi:hypothetical protein
MEMMLRELTSLPPSLHTILMRVRNQDACRGGWSPTGEQSFGRWLSTPDGRLRLTVEVMPDGSWEWVAWFPATPSRCQSGLSHSVTAAMVEAELVATAITRAASRPPRRSIGHTSRIWGSAE